jgi:hypothetical protein
MDDRQLGQSLAAAVAESSPVDPSKVAEVLHDLLPPYDPRLEPLQELAQRPEFLALASQHGPRPQLQAQREALLKDLGEIHGPEMVDRVGAVLEGLLEKGPLPASEAIQPGDAAFSDAPDPRDAPGPISDAAWQKHWQSVHSAAVETSVSSTNAPDREIDASVPIRPRTLRENRFERPPEDRNGRGVWWLVGAVATMGLVVAGGLIALRANHFCKSLGFCSVESFNAASIAVNSAQQTATQLQKANTISAYEGVSKTLERQLQRIEDAGVVSEAQRNSLKSLRGDLSLALARLEREKGDLQILQQVRAEISKGLPGLPSNAQRLRLLSRLQPIAPDSFSHKEAQALRGQLRPPQVIPIDEPSRPSPYSPYRQPPVPTPSVQEERRSVNAPYRPEPLW